MRLTNLKAVSVWLMLTWSFCLLTSGSHPQEPQKPVTDSAKAKIHEMQAVQLDAFKKNMQKMDSLICRLKLQKKDTTKTK